MLGELLAYQDGDMVIQGDLDGGHKATVYFAGIRVLMLELTNDGEQQLLVDGQVIPREGPFPDARKFMEPFFRRLEQTFGRPVNRDA